MLNFTRGQRNGLIVLSFFIILFAISPNFIDFFKKDYRSDFSIFEKEIEHAQISKKSQTLENKNKIIPLFEFNPNIASKTDFLNLGLLTI